LESGGPTVNSKQEVQEKFSHGRGADRWSRLYERAQGVFEHSMVQRRDYVCEYVRGHLAASSQVLDLGCGTGVVCEQLARDGMEVVGMDLSADMVSHARARVDHAIADRCRLLRGDCERLPYRNGQFDLVVCCGVISFLKSNEPTLSEVRRVLRDGGTLILAVRNKWALAKLLDPLKLGKRLLAKLVRRSRRLRAASRDASADDDVSLPRFFHVPRLTAVLEHDGYTLIEEKRIGYGPLTFNGWELLPPTVSVGMSNLLSRAFRLPVLRGFQGLADVCVLVVSKREVGGR
jgi:ubiquinone/menaquinone biosynthesis C-methylase UbiE